MGATVDLLRRELLKRQADAGIARLTPMPTEGRGMALALARPDDEIDYILATHPTHSTLGSLIRHFSTDPDGTTTYDVESHDPQRLVNIASKATRHFMTGGIAAASMLDWPNIERMTIFAATAAREYERLEAQLEEGRP